MRIEKEMAVGMVVLWQLAALAAGMTEPDQGSTGNVPAVVVSPPVAGVAATVTGGVGAAAAATGAVVRVDVVTNRVVGEGHATGVVVRGSSSTGVVAQAGSTGTVAGVTFGDAATNHTVITSRQLLFDYRRSIAMFEGDVVVVDPQMRILSDRLIAVFGESNSVQTVTALDNVRIFNGDRLGTCDRAIYRVPLGEILLTGSPVLRREKDVLKGDRITFWTDREVVLCEPGQLVLSPASVKEKP